MRSRHRSLVLLGLVALLTSGCASAAPASSGDVTTGAGDGAGMEVRAGWIDGGRHLVLVTQGSSTCVPAAEEVTLRDDGVLQVELVDPEQQACTADLAPRATLVAVPAGADVSAGLDVEVTSRDDGFGATDLAGYTGGEVAENAPSAGWVDDSTLAILTWGSSSCAPTVESATVAGTEASITFAAQDADRMCTMDMAPRVALAHVEGGGAATTAILTGGDFAEPVTVPVAG